MLPESVARGKAETCTAAGESFPPRGRKRPIEAEEAAWADEWPPGRRSLRRLRCIQACAGRKSYGQKRLCLMGCCRAAALPKSWTVALPSRESPQRGLAGIGRGVSARPQTGRSASVAATEDVTIGPGAGCDAILAEERGATLIPARRRARVVGMRAAGLALELQGQTMRRLALLLRGHALHRGGDGPDYATSAGVMASGGCSESRRGQTATLWAL